MKKLTVVTMTMLMFFSMGVLAHATLFTLESYSISAYDGESGLFIKTEPFMASNYSFSLNAGQSTGSLDFFKIWTPEGWVNDDDLFPRDIAVNLNFSEPPPPFGGPVPGQTIGAVRLWGVYQYGKVTWNDPVTFHYGPNDDGLLWVSLSDEIFNEGLGGLGCKGAIVDITFKNLQDASPVPEPCTMLLLGSGLVGVAAFRRKSKKA